ncbi:MAG: glycerate kinase, partial [Gordonia amarae]
TSAAIGRGVPAIVFAGQVTLPAEEIADAGIAGAYAIVDRAGSVEVAMSDAAAQLTGLAADVAARWGD